MFTFGYGSEHDAVLLLGIAEAGNGLFYYIDSEESIPESFCDCLGGLLSVAAQVWGGGGQGDGMGGRREDGEGGGGRGRKEGGGGDRELNTAPLSAQNFTRTVLCRLVGRDPS